MSANDIQEGGDHYKRMKVQPWDAMEAQMPALAFQGYLVGSAQAYLARVFTVGVPGKGGKQDVRKAKHVLEKLLEVMPDEGPEKPE
jgi:hypothetical protein